MMKLIFGPTFNRLIEIIFIALGLLIIPLCVSNNRLDSLFSNNVITYQGFLELFLIHLWTTIHL